MTSSHDPSMLRVEAALCLCRHAFLCMICWYLSQTSLHLPVSLSLCLSVCLSVFLLHSAFASLCGVCLCDSARACLFTSVCTSLSDRVWALVTHLIFVPTLSACSGSRLCILSCSHLYAQVVHSIVQPFDQQLCRRNGGQKKAPKEQKDGSQSNEEQKGRQVQKHQ